MSRNQFTFHSIDCLIDTEYTQDIEVPYIQIFGVLSEKYSCLEMFLVGMIERSES